MAREVSVDGFVGEGFKRVCVFDEEGAGAASSAREGKRELDALEPGGGIDGVGEFERERGTRKTKRTVVVSTALGVIDLERPVILDESHRRRHGPFQSHKKPSILRGTATSRAASCGLGRFFFIFLYFGLCRR